MDEKVVRDEGSDNGIPDPAVNRKAVRAPGSFPEVPLVVSIPDATGYSGSDADDAPAHCDPGKL
jgi:hypothetical protein